MRFFPNQTDTDEIEIYVGCCCNHPSHVIKISHYPDMDEDLWFSFINTPRTFTEKMKAIWNILFAGGDTVHEVLLDQDTWHALAEKMATRAILNPKNNE